MVIRFHLIIYLLPIVDMMINYSMSSSMDCIILMQSVNLYIDRIYDSYSFAILKYKKQKIRRPTIYTLETKVLDQCLLL